MSEYGTCHEEVLVGGERVVCGRPVMRPLWLGEAKPGVLNGIDRCSRCRVRRAREEKLREGMVSALYPRKQRRKR